MSVTPSGRYKRVLLKVSGEALAPPSENGIDMGEVSTLADQIARCSKTGCQLAIVVGGGNLIRGSRFSTRAMSFKSPPHITWECSAR
ncbi:MAG: hypothetical protein QM753_21070 [Thermomicrobiales bacterium]